jgi:signal transduction histidine kinase
VLFGIVYWISGDVLYEQSRALLRNEMASLGTNGARTPVETLVTEINTRIRRSGSRSFYYSLQEPSGKRLAGNLPGLDARPGWHEIMLPEESEAGDHSEAHEEEDDEDQIVLLALGRRLENGYDLTVAVDTYGAREAEEAIVGSFAWAAGVGLLLALIGGVLLSRGFLRRIAEINRATRAIINGNLSERIRIGETGDELDQLGSNLNEMLDRLAELMEGLKQVSNDVAHDLRTPLSRLKQRLEAVRLEAQTKQDYEQAVDEALQDADGALSIFGAILRIAQIETGSRRANFSDVDLSELVAGLAMTYAPVAEDLGKVLISHIEGDWHVRGDRELLTQMFVNLIENALRHTPLGANVGLSVHNTGPGLTAEVYDNGPGVPKAERKKIFGRFYRLENSRSTPGNGLGLTLVAAVAALHGIRISLADNHPGLKVTLRFEDAAPS